MYHHQTHYQVVGRNEQMQMVEHIMWIILDDLRSGNVQQGIYFPWIVLFWQKNILISNVPYWHRHPSPPSETDIDAAAMEFERRFHISVDASDNRDSHQVNIAAKFIVLFSLRLYLHIPSTTYIACLNWKFVHNIEMCMAQQ